MNDASLKDFCESLIAAQQRIAGALERIADALTVPTCGHGSVGFCNVCFGQALSVLGRAR